MSRLDAGTPVAVPSRRNILAGMAGAATVGFAPWGHGQVAAQVPLTLHGPPAIPSLVPAWIAVNRSEALPGDVRFALWRTGDQMRAGAVSGRMQAFVASTHSIANLHTRGARVRLLNVICWRLLHVVATADAGISRIEDLAGRQLLVAARNDVPDLMLRFLLGQAGMAVGQDVTVDYVATSAQAAQMLGAGLSDLAVLPEQPATVAIRAAASQGRRLERVLDFAVEFGRLTGGPPRIAQVGIALAEDLMTERPDLADALHHRCRDATEALNDDPETEVRQVAELLPAPTDVMVEALPHVDLHAVGAQAAQEDVMHYLSALAELSPDIIGGRLPSTDLFLNV